MRSIIIYPKYKDLMMNKDTLKILLSRQSQSNLISREEL